MSQSIDIVIVGAGMAGLSAARVLSSAGISCRIFDKGRGFGGRMSRRRAGDAVFDHGAQHFTAKSPEFQALVDEAVTAGVVTVWSHGFDGKKGHPRYRGTEGMTSLPKWMASGLDIRRESRVESIQRTDDKYILAIEGQNPVQCRALLLTAPVPQSLELIDSESVSTDQQLQEDLQQISYAPCFALMVTLDGPSTLNEPGGRLFDPPEPVAWIADNTLKGISSGPAALTIHAGPEFSREHFDDDQDEVAAMLLKAAAPVIGNAKVTSQQLHRWKYALVDSKWNGPKPYAEVSEHPPLILAGDGFHSARVEGAFLSGRAAATRMLELIGD